jgi:hypothetical protein
MLKTTTSRLALALLGYVLLSILFLTFNPFYLAIPDRIHFEFHTYPEDVIENLILFLPVGFLYRLITKRRGAWLLGAAISAGIELFQIFIPARTSSPTDLLNNTLGAGLGALFYDLLAARIALTPKLIGRLRLETPLMGFIYLLIPLLWVDGLALAESSQRWPLTFLLGVCGAIVFNDVYRSWLDQKGPRLILRVSFATGAWFLFGAGISLLHPFPIAWVILAVIMATVVITLLPRQFPDRRFERLSLQRLIPVFALYIILLALWPPDRPITDWHGLFGLTNQIQETEWQGLLPRSEYLAAFSILGYLAADWRGRAELTVAQDLPRLLAVAGGSALVLEILVGFQAGMGASLVRFVLVTVAALYGGVIYHFLRDHIRFLCGRDDKVDGP